MKNFSGKSREYVIKYSSLYSHCWLDTGMVERQGVLTSHLPASLPPFPPPPSYPFFLLSSLTPPLVASLCDLCFLLQNFMEG